MCDTKDGSFEKFVKQTTTSSSNVKLLLGTISFLNNQSQKKYMNYWC